MKFKKFLDKTNEKEEPTFFIGKKRDIEQVNSNNLSDKLKKLIPFIGKSRDIDKLEEKFNSELLHVTEPHRDEHDFDFQKDQFKDSHPQLDWTPAHENFSSFEHLKNITNIADEHQAKAVHLYSGSGSSTINNKLLRASKVLPGRKKYAPKIHDYKKHQQTDLAHADSNLSRLIKNNKTSKDMHVYSGLGFTPENHTHKPSFHLPAYTSTSLSKRFAMNWGGKISNSKHFYNAKGEQLNVKQHSIAHQKYQDNYLKDLSHPDVKHYKDKYDGMTHYSHAVHIHVPADSHAFYTHHEPYTYKKVNEYGDTVDHTIATRHPTEQEVILHKGAKVHIHPKPTVDHEKKVVLWHAKLIHDGVKPTKFGGAK